VRVGACGYFCPRSVVCVLAAALKKLVYFFRGLIDPSGGVAVEG